MSTATQTAQERKAQERYQSGRSILLRLVVTLTFIGAIYLSGKLGISAAIKRFPGKSEATATIPADAPVTLGESGDPIYLAESPDSLRTFFSRFPTEQERTSANLSGLGIRRLGGTLDLTTIQADADAVQVRVSSGPMAGAIYWLHHSQMPGPSAFDPIISPIPEN
ncbi:MAG: hypothetical protein CMO55_05575 [Verrucomicrobiales bacterium]|nr:hypothetical protein [Verrucomicrobiales bacterium]